MKKRKILCFVLALAMAGGVLAGCTGGGEEASSGELPTLTWLIPGGKQADMEEVMAEFNKMTSEKIGVNADIQFIDDGAFTERMNMNLASNSGFDMCFTGYVNPYYNAAKRGGYLELDSYLEQHTALRDALPDYAWEGAKIEGKIYAVPNLQIMASGKALTVQKEYAEKYNLDMSTITKCEDIEPFLEQIKQNEPDLYPFNTSWGVWSFEPFPSGWSSLLNYCIAIPQEDGSYEVTPMLEQDSYQHYIELLRSWFEKGYIRKDVASVMDDTQDVKAGKYVVSVGTYKPGMDAENLASTGIETISVPISDMTLGKGDTTMIAVARNTKYPDEAVSLIEMLNTDKDLYNLISFGIEGKHYNKVGENRIELLGGESSGYRPNASWKFGNQFNAYLLPGQEDDVWEETIALNENAVQTPLLGFRANTDPITTEISQVETVVKTYKVMDNGSDDPANYMDEYMQRMDDAGIQKICDELEKQIAEYLAANQ